MQNLIEMLIFCSLFRLFHTHFIWFVYATDEYASVCIIHYTHVSLTDNIYPVERLETEEQHCIFYISAKTKLFQGDANRVSYLCATILVKAIPT